MDDLSLAVADYALMFPDEESLGVGDPPAAWKAEYDRVRSIALGATMAVGTSDDGSSVSAIRNFDQKTLMHALHIRRNQLDETYTMPFEERPAVTRRRLGIHVRLGG